ncbi:coadhesin-like [Mytilus trossulus]|uniref:coadhesin-like n=1 Tax=Mytilus trossulus TaxID=6551 RepID=UPI0030040E05
MEVSTLSLLNGKFDSPTNCSPHLHFPANWGEWGAWNSCPVTCGGGQRISYRFCDDPPPSAGGSNCIGSNLKTDVCATDTCPVHGNWERWGAWNRCPVTCGGGRQISNRACNDPSPSNGGSACSGNSKKLRSCASDECPVHGNWGGWGAWNRCPVTCGGGRQISNRACNDPSPSGGGSACGTDSKKFRSCASDECPVQGNWGGWGAWNRCSVTCGGGRQISNRACNDPSPSGGGSACGGNSKKFRSCATKECPVHGNWGGWGAWNSCPVTCGGGRQISNRACNDPSPSGGGSACSGYSKKFRSCATNACPGK